MLSLVVTLGFGGRSVERLVNISLPHHDAVYSLRKFNITIIDAGVDYAKALVYDQDIDLLRAAGYQVEIVIEDYKAYKDELFNRGFYHTYDQVYLVLDSFVTLYPGICRLDTIGSSVQGRPIWAMRVTDNPGTEENEAEIRLAGNMHGDEHIGTEVTLYYLRYLLENYASNSQIQDLVNNREIWILPTINPDGKVANTRRNANNVDLNRDYGFFWNGEGSSPGPSSQIENKVMMQHLEENNVSLEYNYHSAAEYVNYPWDYHHADPADSQHIVNLSEIYADSANLTAINGYDWYQVTGSLQDYTIGTSGALAWTIETLEPSGSSAIDQICYDNRDALMDVCNRAGWGIEGVVKDSTTGIALYARIEFTTPDRIDVYTDPALGDFHKMIAPGTYDLRISANGYAPQEVNNVVVPATGSVSVGDIMLASDSGYLFAFKAVVCRYSNHAEQSNRTRPRNVVGPEDNVSFSLGQAGYIVIDMGSGTPITNSSGDDFTVFEGDDGTNEGYEVLASNTWEGPWSSCGTATGTHSFDLATAGVPTARYLRIVDDGSASSGQYAGFDLDAVLGTPPENAPNLYISDHQILDGGNGMLEPGETADLEITLHNAGILAALNTHATLRTSDIYITISDSLSDYGTILPDSEKTNAGDLFTVTASPSTPIGHSVHFDVLTYADGYEDTLDLDIVVGQKHYYLWNADPTPTPGENCHAILGTLGYAGDYGTSLASDLSQYMAVLVCVGIYPSNHVIPNGSAEATALENFLQNQNGRMYLEGGDVWYYDPLIGGHDFGPLFGINATGDGTSDMGPVEGQSGTFANGMYFTYGGENSYMDHITPTGTGFLIFRDVTPGYDCGVANDVGMYRTVGTSFELGLLTDGSGVSTRAALLDSIMKFFGIIIPGVEEAEGMTGLPLKTQLSALYPNPGVRQMQVAYQLAQPAGVQLVVYDAAGRLVRTLCDAVQEPGYYAVRWNGCDDAGRTASAGVYFVRLHAEDYEGIDKFVLLR